MPIIYKDCYLFNEILIKACPKFKYTCLVYLSNVAATTINRRWHFRHMHDMTIHHSSPLKGLMHLNYVPVCTDILLHIDASTKSGIWLHAYSSYYVLWTRYNTICTKKNNDILATQQFPVKFIKIFFFARVNHVIDKILIIYGILGV